MALVDDYVARVEAACRRVDYSNFERRLETLLAEEQAVRAEFLRTPAATVNGIVTKLRVVDQFFAWSGDRDEARNYHSCLMAQTLREAERVART